MKITFVQNEEEKEESDTHADVMAWSSESSRGISVADRYRVTADFCPPENLEDGDEDV